AEEREENAEDKKLRPQIAQRDQRYTGEEGPRARNEIRRTRTYHLAAASEPDHYGSLGGKSRPVVAARDPVNHATSQVRIEARAQPVPSPCYFAQLGHQSVRTRAHHHHVDARESRASGGGKDHHARQTRT